MKNCAVSIIYKNDDGIALFLVLWVIVLLSVIAGEFCYSMRKELSVTRNYMDTTTAYYVSVAGINRALYEILNGMGESKKIVYQINSDNDAILWKVNTELPSLPYDTGSYQLYIGNESGKININVADKKLLKWVMDSFAIDSGQKETIIDSIIDWKDKDHLHGLSGAENEYYQNLEKPYSCKNLEFEDINELLFVKGVTKGLFWGGLKNIFTAREDKEQKKLDELKRRRTKNTNEIEYCKININAASPEVLRIFPGMTEKKVNKVISYRTEQDFLSNDEARAVIGSPFSAFHKYITYKMNPFYSIRSTGTAGNEHPTYIIETLIELDKDASKGYKILKWAGESYFMLSQSNNRQIKRE